MRKAIAPLVLSLWAGTAMATPADDLARALRADDVAGAEAALKAGAPPGARLAFGASPLHWAVETQDNALVALLLAHKADANAADDDGATPLSLACEHGDAGIVERLLAAGASAGATVAGKVTPLAICARHAPASTVAALLARGAPADAVDDGGQTALMWAASAGRADAVALLIKAGADPRRSTTAGFTPLLFAIKGGSRDAVQALLAAGADPGHRGPENTSAVQLAVYQKAWAIAAHLVSLGAADLAERDRHGHTLLQAAAAAGQADLAALLIDKGASVDALSGPSRLVWRTESNFGIAPPRIPPQTALLLAAARGHATVMKLLVARGADPRFTADDGTNAVLAAAASGNAASLATALEGAPDANVANAGKVTPLHMVLGRVTDPDFSAMLATLASHGARSDIPDAKGRTAEDLAAGLRKDDMTLYRVSFPASAPAHTPVPRPAR